MMNLECFNKIPSKVSILESLMSNKEIEFLKGRMWMLDQIKLSMDYLLMKSRYFLIKGRCVKSWFAKMIEEGFLI